MPGMTQTRQPAGIPTGGQFAAGAQGRSSVSLDDSAACKRIGTRVYDPEPSAPITAQPTDRRGVWSIDHATFVSPADQRQRNLTTAAVIGDMDERPGDPGSALHLARQLAEQGKPMTVLTTDPYGNVRAIEGRGSISTDGRKTPFIQLKGGQTSGYALDGEYAIPVLSVRSGYGGQDSLAVEYERRKGMVPQIEPAHFDGIPDYNWREEPPSAIAAAFLVPGPSNHTDDGKPVPGCMFFATDIQAEDGIVNGYHWFPKGSGLIPEHGSMYVRDIEHHGGRIKGYEPGALSFGDLLNKKLPRSRVEAYRAVQGQTYYDE